MSQTVVLGVDIGTSSIKYSLIAPSGECVLSTSSEYPLARPAPGQFEIDVEDLWQRIAASIRAIVDSSSGRFDIEGVCACAMMIMPVFLDAQQKVVRPVDSLAGRTPSRAVRPAEGAGQGQDHCGTLGKPPDRGKHAERHRMGPGARAGAL